MLPFHRIARFPHTRGRKRIIAALRERAELLDAQATPGDLGADDRRIVNAYQAVILDLEREGSPSRPRAAAVAQ